MPTTKTPTPEQAATTDIGLALKITEDTRVDLELLCEDLLGEGLVATVVRCRQGDLEARAAGGTKGWRPSGRAAFPIRMALELVGL